MGKRLDQQPMYPQYTYYYPHYLQTKVGYGGAGTGLAAESGAAQIAGSLLLLSDSSVASSGSVSCKTELVGRRQA